MARYPEDPDKLIDRMIRQGRPADEIAAEGGVKEHFILGRMEDLARRDVGEKAPARRREMERYTIAHIRRVLDWLDVRGCPQWRQQLAYEAMTSKRRS